MARNRLYPCGSGYGAENRHSNEARKTCKGRHTAKVRPLPARFPHSSGTDTPHLPGAILVGVFRGACGQIVTNDSWYYALPAGRYCE